MVGKGLGVCNVLYIEYVYFRFYIIILIMKIDF